MIEFLNKNESTYVEKAKVMSTLFEKKFQVWKEEIIKVRSTTKLYGK